MTLQLRSQVRKNGEQLALRCAAAWRPQPEARQKRLLHLLVILYAMYSEEFDREASALHYLKRLTPKTVLGAPCFGFLLLQLLSTPATPSN
eukprot:2055496-Rhodomonas_salina.1